MKIFFFERAPNGPLKLTLYLRSEFVPPPCLHEDYLLDLKFKILLKPMVKEILKNKKYYYICEECGLAYKDKAWAEKRQNFCSKHHACSIEITKYAIQLN